MNGWRDVAAEVRRRQPLVHCLSAAVSMNIVADGLLAAGARPMMTETEDEAPAMNAVADALLINLGTLSTDGARGIPATVSAAAGRGLPWVLDPTAVGLAPVRTALAATLLDRSPCIVRGNASEILALAGAGRGGRGADSTASSFDARDAAAQLARRHGTVVAVSGEVDVIVGPETQVEIALGTPLLTRLTGTGCLLGALCAAGAAVVDPLDAAVAATTWLNTAAEHAARRSVRPGSFRVFLLDALDEVAS
ncbi:MAG TPA: hydroxyethylthiazole kinase [Arachnia sp.]|nr:hydroxyethylthiazole kinase [Arachnia sp.]HMT86566.1 hydroxyethylthiazole kinase [Arachnia sp.]